MYYYLTLIVGIYLLADMGIIIYALEASIYFFQNKVCYAKNLQCSLQITVQMQICNKNMNFRQYFLLDVNIFLHHKQFDGSNKNLIKSTFLIY